jgi:DNA-binding CsgD family transcriptional regulator
MKHSKSMAYLRQLCCLGFGKDIVIPEFLKAVESVIPSGNNILTHLDEKGVPVSVIINLFIPDIVIIARELIPSYHIPERNRIFLEQVKRNGAITNEVFAEENFYQSDLYHLVFKPCEQDYFIQIPVYQDHQLVELFWLFRPHSSHKPFTLEEQKLAMQLSPYISHALRERPDNTEWDYVESGQSSLIIANNNGDMVYLSKGAQRLLALATELERFKSGLLHKVKLPPVLVKLCQNLDGIFKGEAAMPPVLTQINPYGKFVFRAYWLNKLNNEPGGLIGISIEHQEPQDLAVLRALKNVALSPAQKQVALMLTQGLSNEHIGQKLHIKPSTVKDHIHKIFIRMDINQRHELLPKLMEAGQLCLKNIDFDSILH